MTGRLAVAREAGFDERLVAELAAPATSALSPRQRVVIDFADAIMTMPGAITPELRAQLHAHLSRTEIIAVLLNVLSFNAQKVTVAAGHDVEAQPGREEFRFDAQGRVQRHAEARPLSKVDRPTALGGE